MRHEVTRDREGADRPHAQRIAVGRRLGGEIETHGQRAARTVVDDDLLTYFIGKRGTKQARDRVGCAAGGLRHDEMDRTVRILGRGAGRKGAREQGDDQS